MRKTKTFDVYDEVWVMEGNRPSRKSIKKITICSFIWNKREIQTIYGLIDYNETDKDKYESCAFYNKDVFKDKQSLMNSVFDLDKETK